MSIRIACTQCKTVAEVPDSAAGKRGKCRVCGSIVQVPGRPEVCCVCGLDVSQTQPVRDNRGNRYCHPCWDAALTQAARAPDAGDSAARSRVPANGAKEGWSDAKIVKVTVGLGIGAVAVALIIFGVWAWWGKHQVSSLLAMKAAADSMKASGDWSAASRKYAEAVRYAEGHGLDGESVRGEVAACRAGRDEAEAKAEKLAAEQKKRDEARAAEEEAARVKAEQERQVKAEQERQKDMVGQITGEVWVQTRGGSVVPIAGDKLLLFPSVVASGGLAPHDIGLLKSIEEIHRKSATKMCNDPGELIQLVGMKKKLLVDDLAATIQRLGDGSRPMPIEAVYKGMCLQLKLKLDSAVRQPEFESMQLAYQTLPFNDWLPKTAIAQTTTDRDGKFAFSKVPPGKYVLGYCQPKEAFNQIVLWAEPVEVSNGGQCSVVLNQKNAMTVP